MSKLRDKIRLIMANNSDKEIVFNAVMGEVNKELNDIGKRFDVCKRGILEHKFKIKELREKKKNSFGYRIAKVMDDLKSSHCFFIIQMAYKDIYGEGGMAWEEAQIKIDKELEREGK